MRAYDIMKKQVIKVKQGDTVGLVIEKMIYYGISGVPIVNDHNEVIAYVSDGDIMRYIGAQKDLAFGTIFFVDVFKGDYDSFEERAMKILDLDVMNIAQKKVFRVEWNEKIEKIAALLGEKRIKKLPVERNGVLVGIISRGDVVRKAFDPYFVQACIK